MPRGHGTPKRPQLVALRTERQIEADHRAAVARAKASGWPSDPRYLGIVLRAFWADLAGGPVDLNRAA